MGVVQNLCREKTTSLQPSLLRRRRVGHMRGSIEESNGLSAIAVRQALATAEGVYADIRRGFPRGEEYRYRL